MNDVRQTDPSPGRNLGQIAFSVMGWVELTVSVITFILDVYIAAVAFGVGAIFMTLIATQVKRQRYDLPGNRDRQPARPAVQRSGTAYWVQLGLAAALIVTAVVFLLLKNYSFAAVFVIWALVFSLFAHRTAMPAV